MNLQPSSFAGRLAIALVLLAPLPIDLLMRGTPRAAMLPIAGVYVAAVLLFALLAPPLLAPPAAGESGRPRPRWPLLGLAGALLALELWMAWRDVRDWWLLPVWLGGVAAWLAAWMPRPSLPRLSRGQWLGLGAVLLVAAALRLIRLDLQPLQVDELVVSQIALRRWARAFEEVGVGLPLFVQAPDDGNSQLLLGATRRLLVFRLLGIDFTTLRLSSALVGVLEIGLLFFVGRALFGVRVGLAAAAILASLTAHLNFSRHGDDNVEGSLVWTLTALLLAYAFARRSAVLLALAGASLSLAFYLYLSARPMIAVTVVLLLMAALDPRLRGRWLAVGSAALVGGLLVGAGPLLVTYYRTPAIFTYSQELAPVVQAALARYAASGNLADLQPLLTEQLVPALLGYTVHPGGDNRYAAGRGIFLWLPSALLFAGAALACLRLSDWRYRLLAAWFWAPTLGLSALSANPPAMHRLLPVLPACALLIALGLDRVVVSWERLGPWARRAAAPIAALALAPFLIQEGAFYFGDYARRDRNPIEDLLIRHVTTLPEGTHVAVARALGDIQFSLLFATDNGRARSYAELQRPTQEVPNLAGSAGAVYLIPPGRASWLGPLRGAYPGGVETPLVSTDPLGDRAPVWIAYAVGPKELAEAGGLAMSARDAAGRRLDMRAPAISVAEPPAGDLSYPIELEWRGWLAPGAANEQIEIASIGKVTPTLQLGDDAVDLAPGAAVRVKPYPAARPIRAAARLGVPGDTVELRWGGGAAGLGAFPAGRASAWPGVPRVTVEWLRGTTPEPIRRDYDVGIVDHALSRSALERPLTVRWSASLRVAERASYELDVDSDGPARLVIDNRTVPLSRGGSGTAQLWLDPGAHPIVVERTWGAGERLSLAWRRASGAWSLVHGDALEPLPWP